MGESLAFDPDFIGKAMKGLRYEVRTAFYEVIGELSAFKIIVPKDGRITIPEAERKVLGIKEKDVLQVFIMKIKEKGETGA